MHVFSKIAVGLLISPIAWATSVPNFMHYDGVLKDTNGNPLSGTTIFTVQYYAPGNSGCILYRETFNRNIAAGDEGAFSLKLGAGTPTFNPASLNEIMANGILRNCDVSGSYTPSAGETRMVRITVDNGGQNATLSPDLELGTAPYAFHAGSSLKLGNKPASEFLQTDPSNNITQANLINILSSSGYNDLIALLDGSSPRFSPAASTVNSSAIIDGSITTAKIANGSVDLNKLSQMAGPGLLGRGDTGAGPVAPITIGSGLTLSGGTLSASGGGSVLVPANNLSDLSNLTTARTNLGLGTAATKNFGTAANNLVELPAAGILPPLSGSALTDLNAGQITTGVVPAMRLPPQLQSFNNLTCSFGQIAVSTGSIWDCGNLPAPPPPVEPFAGKDALRALFMATRNSDEPLVYLYNGFLDPLNTLSAVPVIGTAAHDPLAGTITNVPTTIHAATIAGWDFESGFFIFSGSNITTINNMYMNPRAAAHNTSLSGPFKVSFTPSNNFNMGLFDGSFSPNNTSGIEQFSGSSPFSVSVAMGILSVYSGAGAGATQIGSFPFTLGQVVEIQRLTNNKIKISVNGLQKWMSTASIVGPYRVFIGNVSANGVFANFEISSQAVGPSVVQFEGEKQAFENGITDFNEGRVTLVYSTNDGLPAPNSSDINLRLKENFNGFTSPSSTSTSKFYDGFYIATYNYNLSSASSGPGLLRYEAVVQSNRTYTIHAIAVEGK